MWRDYYCQSVPMHYWLVLMQCIENMCVFYGVKRRRTTDAGRTTMTAIATATETMTTSQQYVFTIWTLFAFQIVMFSSPGVIANRLQQMTIAECTHLPFWCTMLGRKINHRAPYTFCSGNIWLWPKTYTVRIFVSSIKTIDAADGRKLTDFKFMSTLTDAILSAEFQVWLIRCDGRKIIANFEVTPSLKISMKRFVSFRDSLRPC